MIPVPPPWASLAAAPGGTSSAMFKKMAARILESGKNLKDWFQDVDQYQATKKRDGKLSLTEFCDFVQKIDTTVTQEELRQLFAQFDVKRTGMIDLYDFCKALDKAF